MLPGLLLAGSLCAGPDPWAQLKPGLTPESVTALLGAPVLLTKGHGTQTWIYDNGGEVLIRDTLVEWTQPAMPPSATPTRAPAPHLAPKQPVKPAVVIAPPPAAKATVPPTDAKEKALQFFPKPAESAP